MSSKKPTLQSYTDVKQILDIFLSSGDEELYYQLPTRGAAINFMQRVGRFRKIAAMKAGDSDVPGHIPPSPYDRIRVSPHNFQIKRTDKNLADKAPHTICFSFSIDEQGLPTKGKFVDSEGNPITPKLPDSEPQELISHEESLEDRLNAAKQLFED